MLKKVIHAEAAPRAVGPYSQAIEANGFVYTAGQLPINPHTGMLISDDVAAQTRQALENIKAVLKACGLGLDAVVKTTVFLRDISDFGNVNAVYASFFNDNPPARTTVQVAALPKGAKVEIEAIAVR